MATDAVPSLLERSDPSKLFCEVPDPQETGEAEMMGSYLMACRQKQKLMCQQLCMLDSLMEFLGGLNSKTDFLNDQCPKASEGEAREKWKALKREYEGDLAEVEQLIGSLLQRSEQLQDRRDTLETLVRLLQQKKEECQAVARIRKKRNQMAMTQVSLRRDDSLQASQHALRSCERQLTQLRQQSDALQSVLDQRTRLRDQLWSCVQVWQGLGQYRVQRVSASEICVELRPQGRQLEPLQLRVTSKPPRHCHLQVLQGNAGMLEETINWPMEQLSAALLAVMQSYISQGPMLAEIQALRSSFAIDWRPAQRLLVFLKTASVVCHLVVEEGYPSQGTATLQAVRKDGRDLNIATLQPPSQQPSLTEWLEFLSCCPGV
ncbi:hypothetical protein ACEWY4_002337 [Coilia grayii]|uniref:Uncharacterized protein n=1 Tax=Coilia grayii TaxID=363190 RepID=A0ABD1KNN7_9TELE